ncbi:MAG: pentapeptide repeat-containing protein [Caldilineaceae bacterium]|nr:pentapeptide repeat-containing protein [Caldilineaceae bacterium]
MTNQAKQYPKPRLSPRLTPMPDAADRIEDFAEFTTVLLERSDFTGQRAAHLTFTDLHGKQLRWCESRLHKPRCTDVRLESCDLANATWEQWAAQRMELLDCQLLGFNTLEAYLQQVRFQGCNGQFASFRFSILKMVRFEQCDLRQADFQRTDLSGVVFHKCDLRGAQLSGATLKGTDFRGSQIEELRVGLQELPGAIVDPFQASYIAGLLGVVIKDEHA